MDRLISRLAACVAGTWRATHNCVCTDPSIPNPILRRNPLRLGNTINQLLAAHLPLLQPPQPLLYSPQPPRDNRNLLPPKLSLLHPDPQPRKPLPRKLLVPVMRRPDQRANHLHVLRNFRKLGRRVREDVRHLPTPSFESSRDGLERAERPAFGDAVKDVTDSTATGEHDGGGEGVGRVIAVVDYLVGAVGEGVLAAGAGDAYNVEVGELLPL